MARRSGSKPENLGWRMSNSYLEAKAALRRQLRATALAVSPAERLAASEKICLLVKEQAVWRHARSILFYAPLPGEPDIWPLVTEALSEGKQVTLPRYSRVHDHYEACRIENASGHLATKQFGIREPTAVCPTFPLNLLDLILVPGIGFTLDGHRLGRGKGYYDRLLAEVHGLKCGVAFDWQVTVEIPVEPHDIQLNCILTPTGWHAVSR